MTSVQLLGVGATALFGYKAFQAMQGKQAADIESVQLQALGAQAPAAALATTQEAANVLNGNMLLFGALTLGALGATVLLWNHE